MIEDRFYVYECSSGFYYVVDADTNEEMECFEYYDEALLYADNLNWQEKHSCK